MSLDKILKDKIRAEGPMDVGHFMALVLGHPQHGYYMTRDPLGAGGDFTTAPEISQMFGEVIGAWVADVWMQMGQPERFVLLECGPGRGTLMADVMRATKAAQGFHEACEIVLLEMSSVLKKKQRDILSDYSVRHIERLDDVPTGSGPLIVLANEFLDALPVRQFVKTACGEVERFISLDGDDLILEPSGGDVFEVSAARIEFVQQVCDLIKVCGGAGLFIDYGYDAGSGDTLQALCRHEYCDVLEHIGEADVTAHVDFGALRDAASVSVMLAEQGRFLRALGIEARAARLLSQANEKQASDIQSGLHRLVSPDEMGRLFKVMGVCHDQTLRLAGF